MSCTFKRSAIVLGLLQIISCRSTMSHSDVRVTNSLPAGELYAEVVAIDLIGRNGTPYRCSGTFISKNAIITAAHCLYDVSGEAMQSIRYTASDGTAYFPKALPARTYDYRKPVNASVKSDMAILVFKEAIAPKVAVIPTQPPKALENIVLVGFGLSDNIKQTGDGSKSIGNNRILAIDANTSVIGGYSSAKVAGVDGGLKSVTGYGDSGGGVFNSEGKLIGVISAGDVIDVNDENGVKLSKTNFVNIAHPDSMAQIKEIAARLCQVSTTTQR